MQVALQARIFTALCLMATSLQLSSLPPLCPNSSLAKQVESKGSHASAWHCCHEGILSLCPLLQALRATRVGHKEQIAARLGLRVSSA